MEGVLRVLAALEMIPAEQAPSPPEQPSAVCWTSGWVRARRDGLLQLDVPLGQTVAVGDRLGALYDSFGRRQATVKADRPGIVIGRAEAPLVHRGDALVHIAQDG